MDKEIYNRYIKHFHVNLLDCRYIGKGHNGIIYMLPEGKIIKICFEADSCKKEYFILKRVNGNKYFPKTYGMSGNYMIRDYVEGVTLKDYIKHNGLNKELALKIIKLFDEFKKLKFSKEDIRCKDIIIQKANTLMVIDPKKFYTKKRSFPRHLAKGLYKLGVLDYFLSVVKEEKPKLYSQWNGNVEKYISSNYLNED